jgi:hypothetical protein
MVKFPRASTYIPIVISKLLNILPRAQHEATASNASCAEPQPYRAGGEIVDTHDAPIDSNHREINLTSIII